MGIDMDSIMKKVKAYSESPNGQEEMEKATINKMETSGGSAKFMNIMEIGHLASILVETIAWAAEARFPKGVSEPLNDFIIFDPVLAEINDSYIWYEVDIVYSSPEGLYRPSLAIDKEGNRRTGEGVKNIVALLENGYHANAPVYGYWEGHSDDKKIKSLQHRSGAGVINEEVTKWLKYVRQRAKVDINFNEGVFEDIDTLGWYFTR